MASRESEQILYCQKIALYILLFLDENAPHPSEACLMPHQVLLIPSDHEGLQPMAKKERRDASG